MKMILIRNVDFDEIVQAQENLYCKKLRANQQCFKCPFDDCEYPKEDAQEAS